MATQLIYRFYSELQDYTPKIWRRFEVSGNKSVAVLGYILITLYEMQASHLNSVYMAGVYFGDYTQGSIGSGLPQDICFFLRNVCNLGIGLPQNENRA